MLEAKLPSNFTFDMSRTFWFSETSHNCSFLSVQEWSLHRISTSNQVTCTSGVLYSALSNPTPHKDEVSKVTRVKRPFKCRPAFVQTNFYHLFLDVYRKLNRGRLRRVTKQRRKRRRRKNRGRNEKIRNGYDWLMANCTGWINTANILSWKSK